MDSVNVAQIVNAELNVGVVTKIIRKNFQIVKIAQRVALVIKNVPALIIVNAMNRKSKNKQWPKK